MSEPLAHRRILVTRAAHQAGKLSDGLRALGADPVEVPVLEIRPPLDFAPLDAALRQLTSYDWLIFTSANTVRAAVERAAALGISPVPSEPARNAFEAKGHDFSRAEKQASDEGALAPEGRFPKVAAIGSATAAAARDAGFTVNLVPETYVAESLVESLTTQTKTRKILLARAETARDVIPDALRAAGATLDVVDAYRNVLPESAPALLRDALVQGIDAATFTSSSSVIHLAEAARAAGLAFPFPGVRAISIGPITSATLRENGWEPAAEASRSDISGLIEAVLQSLRTS